MAKYNLVFACSIVLLFLPVQACTDNRNDQQTVFTQEPEIRDIRPNKPVKIKLKRNVTGSYSWELRGDDAEKLLETDGKLRRVLEE